MPPADQIDIPESERLKALGNVHYRNGELAAAQNKFTEAIEKNPTNAVLYANRAAVMLAKKRYSDVIHDCKKAVKLDPSYAKAWGRLGAATNCIDVPFESLRYYTKALACLPQPPSTLAPTDEALKAQFDEGVAKAKAAVQLFENRRDALDVVGVELAKMARPCAKAMALFERKKVDFEASGKPSCVTIIRQAKQRLDMGMSDLANVEFLGTTPTGQGMEMRQTGVLEALSNSILICDRVFHVTNIKDFIKTIEHQIFFENRVLKGWVGDTSGPESVKVKALEGLEKEGWDAVRKAITVTVRAWIFQGMLRQRVFGHEQFAHEMYTNALEILEWGMKEWSNVHTEKKGAIFDRAFMRGVKRIRTENMVRMAMDAKDLTDLPFTLDDLVRISEELAEECDSDEPNTMPDLGSLYAYWQYPKGIALSAIAWCSHRQSLAHLPGTPGASAKARRDLLDKAALNYYQAAGSIPSDDAYHVLFLRKHLECLSDLDKPIRDTLPIAQFVLKAAEGAMEIWGSRSFELQEHADEMKVYIEGCRRHLEQGVCGLDMVRKVKHRQWK